MPDINSAAARALAKIGDKPGVKIAVIGDVILDRFLYGSVERISPEAPVPVVHVGEDVFRLGGAANVLRNLRSMNAGVELLGVVGDDLAAGKFNELLATHDCRGARLVVDSSRPTAVKTRVIAQNQQVVRFDQESLEPFSDDVLKKLGQQVAEAVAGADAVIISDYGKGVICPAVMGAVLGAAGDVPVAVDPKPGNYHLYKGVGVLTPNAKETEEMASVRPTSDEDAVAAGRTILDELGAANVLVTRGEKGMTLVQGDGEVSHIPTRAKDVFDVTGAGDTAISLFTLAWACGAALRDAACLANVASGLVVGKFGTAVVTGDELARALKAERESFAEV